MKYMINTSIIIKAPIEKVWSIFMDFENHIKWESGLKININNAKIGEQINVDFIRKEKIAMSMKPTLIEHINNKSFEWLGHLFIKGIFDGLHKFHFIDLGNDTTEFVQSENFSGLLIRPLVKSVLIPTEISFNNLNKNLKKYIENIN